MADEARSIRDFDTQRQLAEATVSPYQVVQTVTGEAAVYDKAASTASGTYFDLRTQGVYQVAKTTGIVILKGGKVFFDYSARTATYRKVNDRDFYIGRAEEDASSGNNIVNVRLNVDPPADIDLARDAFKSVLVGTPAALANSFGYPKRFGGSHLFQLSATSEAQKVDAVSIAGFAKDANAIIEMAFRLPNGGSGSASDFSIGIANATHASDADTIADSLFIHLDGGSVNIYAESDDGTTEVAATDTTIDFTAGETIAERVEVWFDMRDPADVQIYVNGANVLPAGVFNVDAYAGTWYLIVHLEKTTGTETADLIVDWLRARFSEQ